MGWLWTSNTTAESSKPSPLDENISSDSAPAPPDVVPTAKPPSPQNADPDAELQAVLSSLETTPKPNGSSQRPSDVSTTISDNRTITPASLLPTEMSCRSAFDSAFYCQSLGGQFNNIYRYGTFRDCREQWSQFWFCVRTNKGFLGDQERERRIRDHYKLREMKYRVGSSSEDVWKPRTKMVEGAFDGDNDLEAVERAEGKTVS
ncbi:MAG: hypothetical protein LQ338_002722 [Usnochroma carphineum]|nr:MAG: hypothetical protein LQ338_002722 [Usnochroma carphineum]